MQQIVEPAPIPGLNRPDSALFDFPVTLAMKPELKEPILGVVALTTMGAGWESAPADAAAVASFGNREAIAAAARDEEHPQSGLASIGLGPFLHKNRVLQGAD
jgi:hypothetical protein